MTNLDIEFVTRILGTLPPRQNVVEIGGRHVNGRVDGAFAGAAYCCVDLIAGDGVDIVADAFTWRPKELADTIVCLNVLEHVEDQKRFVSALMEMLGPGGVLLLSFPADPWPPHSAVDGAGLRETEYYRNPDADEVWGWVKSYPLAYMEETYPLPEHQDFPQIFVLVKKQ